MIGKMEFQEIYNKVQGHIQMRVDEAKKLYECAKLLSENAVVVEIGTLHGGSANILAAAISGMVYTIDNDPKFETKILDNVLLIKGDSKDVAIGWDKPIDLLFIDGDHSYEGVAEDIENWIPKVKKGGMVIFHDYGSWTGVTKAVNEAIERKIIGFSSTLLLTING